MCGEVGGAEGENEVFGVMCVGSGGHLSLGRRMGRAAKEALAAELGFVLTFGLAW